MELSLPIIDKGYEALNQVSDITAHLEKKWRIAIGERLQNTVQNCLEQIIMAKHAPKPLKGPYLIRAISQLEICTLYLRTLLEKKTVNETKIFQLQAVFAEIGRMLGGWLKASQ